MERVDLDERKRRVAAAVAEMREHRDTLALLLVWEIGKPWKLACDDVDRGLDGVDWYLGEIERQLQGRSPLPGPVSNIASWNYPMWCRSTPSWCSASPATAWWPRRRRRAASTP